MGAKRGISHTKPALPHCGVVDAPGSAGSSQTAPGNALPTSTVLRRAQGKT